MLYVGQSVQFRGPRRWQNVQHGGRHWPAAGYDRAKNQWSSIAASRGGRGGRRSNRSERPAARTPATLMLHWLMQWSQHTTGVFSLPGDLHVSVADVQILLRVSVRCSPAGHDSTRQDPATRNRSRRRSAMDVRRFLLEDVFRAASRAA